MSKNEKFLKRVKNASAVLAPLILSSLEKIEIISNAMELRGFGKKKKRTWYNARPFQKRDYTAIILFVLLLIATLLITYHDGSRFYNPFS